MTLALVVGAADLSNYLSYDSPVAKFNTLDYTLVDPSSIGTLGQTVTLTDSLSGYSWTGTLVGIEQRPAVGRISGHQYVIHTARNTLAPNLTHAPFDISDVPANTTSNFELESGTGHILTEDGGILLTEGTLSYGTWQDLSVKTQTNNDSTTSTYGSVIVYRDGLQVGQTIIVTCADVSINTTFVIAQVTAYWPAAQIRYQVELGQGTPSAVTPTITGRIWF